MICNKPHQNWFKTGLKLWATVVPNHKKIANRFLSFFLVPGQKSKKKLNLLVTPFYTKEIQKIMFLTPIIKNIPLEEECPLKNLDNLGR